MDLYDLVRHLTSRRGNNNVRCTFEELVRKYGETNVTTVFLNGGDDTLVLCQRGNRTIVFKRCEEDNTYRQFPL